MPYLTKQFAEGREAGITNGEVVLPVRAIRDLHPEVIGLLVLELAGDYEVLKEYLGSGELDFMSIDQAKEYVKSKQQTHRSKEVKTGLVKKRRAEFNSKRAQLMLALIERDGYVCQYLDCDCQEDLGIDHVVPLSKGGSDELVNPRIMCRKHNSEKSDTMPD